MSVKILRPSLDDEIAGNTVLRGILDRESLPNLKTDFYQREKMSTSQRSDIVAALETNSQLPDIDLGMRGEKFNVLEDAAKNPVIELLDPVFIIDGFQRVSTLRDFLVKNPTCLGRLGATVHFNTTPNWERERFHKLNSSRVKVSPNILLRNLKEDVPALAMLYGLSKADNDFVLHDRVTWVQTPGRQDLVSALTYMRVNLRAHSHLIPARFGSDVTGIVSACNRLEKRIGLPLLRDNCRTLWHFIDEVWGIREHKIKANIPYLQLQFLTVLADVLCDHVDFWVQPTETRLTFPYLLKKKLAKLPVYDPEIVRLSGSSGKAHEALYFIVMAHINSGKRHRRLVPRNARATYPTLVTVPEPDDDDDDEDAAA